MQKARYRNSWIGHRRQGRIAPASCPKWIVQFTYNWSFFLLFDTKNVFIWKRWYKNENNPTRQETWKADAEASAEVLLIWCHCLVWMVAFRFSCHMGRRCAFLVRAIEKQSMKCTVQLTIESILSSPCMAASEKDLKCCEFIGDKFDAIP